MSSSLGKTRVAALSIAVASAAVVVVLVASNAHASTQQNQEKNEIIAVVEMPDRVEVVHHAVDAVAGIVYAVQPGDTLSSIAAAHMGSASAWPAIWKANNLADPDAIQIGQNLTIPPPGTPVPAIPVSAPKPAPAPVETVSVDNAYVNPRGYGGFQQCVIERESGGNPQVMNGSGHYGLYQFSYSTWVAYGGSRADFGHASVAEQNQVFANAMARHGESNWSPYDGC